MTLAQEQATDWIKIIAQKFYQNHYSSATTSTTTTPENEIFYARNSMKRNKPPGSDDIMKMLNEAQEVISPLPKHIFNGCLEQERNNNSYTVQKKKSNCWRKLEKYKPVEKVAFRKWYGSGDHKSSGWFFGYLGKQAQYIIVLLKTLCESLSKPSCRVLKAKYLRSIHLLKCIPINLQKALLFLHQETYRPLTFLEDFGFSYPKFHFSSLKLPLNQRSCAVCLSVGVMTFRRRLLSD